MNTPAQNSLNLNSNLQSNLVQFGMPAPAPTKEPGTKPAPTKPAPAPSKPSTPSPNIPVPSTPSPSKVPDVDPDIEIEPCFSGLNILA